MGLMSELRELGHPASAAEYNISGLGVYPARDAKDGDEVRGWLKEKDGDDATDAKGRLRCTWTRVCARGRRPGGRREERETSSPDGGGRAAPAGRRGAGTDVFERR